jgi:predicted O-linked N-acetylglucosamine transferase (SPINDLY family)
MNPTLNNYIKNAEKYIEEGTYRQAIDLYESAISENPKILSYYWYLGLVLLLDGQETEAQMTWMLAFSELESEKSEFYTNELREVLEAEAKRQESIENFTVTWAIRQHIREIKPDDIDNILRICIISSKINISIGDTITNFNIIDILDTELSLNPNEDLLLTLLNKVLEIEPLNPVAIELAAACLKYISQLGNFFYIIISNSIQICHTFHHPKIAAKLLDKYLQIDTNNLEALRHLSAFYQDAREYQQGIETAKLCYSLAHDLPEKIAACHLVLRGLQKAGGYWKEVCSTCNDLESMLEKLVVEQPMLNEVLTLRLMTQAFSIPHIKDTPHQFREIHNKVAKLFQTNIQTVAPEQVAKYSQRHLGNKPKVNSNRLLKIGYLSYCLRHHSVGWLARGLFQHHDREKFEINSYLINHTITGDDIQEWYINKSDNARKLGMNGLEIAEKIYEDEIDILIDLDSVTLDISCQIMAFKPAPVQVTWLGWDASGIPAIDYYIADPYVLPNNAQDYYTEKIYRLPNTYIAVDGFEVGIPTLRRDDLDIPSDAVIYLSAQRGYKRNPETTRWQMRIIKEVPNSYLLIKGLSEEDSIKNFFNILAEEEGVDCSKLRFLPQDASELTHRANLAIADIVLDTYPYNGATTTLETLWMGIPLVTRVGEQFAARNSYTMMMNAGIEEGIAWTDEEYIEWGIRLGKDETLRQQVSWKLRQSRHSAPLWNAKQFTREMEKAYKQMWQIYVEDS